MSEKLSPISRALMAASRMQAPDARSVLMLICQAGMTTDKPVPQEPTEGEKHYAKREKFIKRMKSSTDRVLNYARHETLRNIEKHFRDNPSIKAGEGEGHPFRGNQWVSEGYGQIKDRQDILELIDKNSQGENLSYRALREAIGPEDYVLTKYPVSDLKFEPGSEHVVDPARAHPEKGAIVIGPDKVVIDGRHRSFLAKQKGQQFIDAWIPESHAIKLHFRANPPIHGAEGGTVEDPQPSSLAVRLTFDKELLSSELLAALREDQESALSTAGQQLYDEIGKDSVWRLPSQDAIQFVQDRANLLANVPDEVHAEIMQSIEQGLQHGESRKELMARISAVFDEIARGRAETIANTETAAAFNYARDKAMREAGVTHKKWLHSQSPLIKEPRPTHIEADGQVQPIDEPFDVGGVQFMRPADDSLGAGPEDIINCHCVAIPVEAPIESGDKPGHEFHGNQWTEGITHSGTHEEFGRSVISELPPDVRELAWKSGLTEIRIVDGGLLSNDKEVKSWQESFGTGAMPYSAVGVFYPASGKIAVLWRGSEATKKTLQHEIGHIIGHNYLGDQAAKKIGFTGDTTSERFGSAFAEYLTK